LSSLQGISEELTKKLAKTESEFSKGKKSLDKANREME